MELIKQWWPYVVAIVGFGAAIWQYFLGQLQANKAPFRVKQLALCFEIADVVGILGTTTDPDEFEKARANFWRLYVGPLVLVEDLGVESAMVKLGQLVPREEQSEPELPVGREIRGHCLDVAIAARALVRDSWKVDLSPLMKDASD